MNVTAIISGVALVVGFGLAWGIQGQRWDLDVASIRLAYLDESQAAQKKQSEAIKAAEQQKEQTQNEFKAFRDAEDQRNANLDRGVQRVYVRAKCPAVPAASADPSRAESAAAELDPAYRSTLSALRRDAVEQLRLLNICRAALGAGETK